MTIPSNSRIELDLKKATELYRQGNVRKAETVCDDILKKSPNNLDAIHILGVISLQTNQAKRAAKLFKRAISINGNVCVFHNNLGRALQDLDRLEDAVESYDNAIKLDPNYANAYFNRGIALRALGRLDDAVRSYDRAIDLDPRDAEAHNNKGIVLEELNRLDEALKSYNKAITERADFTEAYSNRGNVLRNLGNLKGALKSYECAIRFKPDCAEAFYNRGNVLAHLNLIEEALHSYDRAIQIRPDYADAHYNKGNTLRKLKLFGEALKSYDRAIEFKSSYAEAYSNRGVVLGELRRFEEALQSYDRAIRLKADYAEAYSNRGIVLGELGRFEAALQSCDRAIALDPDHAEAYTNRGIALGELKRFEEALQSYDRAIELDPEHAKAYSNRGVALFELKRFEEALEAYDRAIRLDPEFADAHTNKGLLLLLLGEFDPGWKSGEWRKKTSKKIGAVNYPQPEWSGREDLAGKTLFIHWEQGLGDTIQFCRLAKLAESRGARVVFSVQDALTRLLKNLSSTVEIIASGSTPEQFDYHVALLSMPLAFNIDENNIPADIPYLRTEPDRREKWKLELGDRGFKIGIAWQGSKLGTEMGKSFPVTWLHNISKLPGVRLISLQKYEGSEQLSALPDDMKVETLGDDFDRGPDAFLDTAAVMENLDLVITTDTSIAHLAGALGRPTWVALKQVPDWRWLLDRDDSPWYPTLRLFRQQKRDDWSSVFSEMESELARRLFR